MAVVIEEEKKPAGLRTSLWEAIKGTEQDFTQGSIGRAVLLLSVPMVLEMAMESLFSLVDVFFVARLGADATATVGLTEAVMAAVYGLAMGLSMATTAMVARRVGEKKPDAAAKAAAQGLFIGAVAAVSVSIAGLHSAEYLLELMGAPPSLLASSSAYTAIIFGSTVVVMLLFLINAVFRGAGDAVRAMHVLWFCNGINIILDPCLIFGLGPFPELGLTGAAIATTIGRSLGVVYQLWLLFGGRGRIRLARRHFVPDPPVMRKLLKLSASGIAQFLIADFAWIALVRIVAIFGSAALAGYTIALRIIIVTIMPAFGMSNAASTLVGQNLGAGQPERAEKSVWMTGFYNMVFLGLVGLNSILFAESIIGIFTSDPEVVPYGVDCLRYVSYGYLAFAWGMVMVQAFNGAGDTVTPMLINISVYWVWQIPLAYVLALVLGAGPTGVFMAIAVAETTVAAVGVLVFRRGKWKERMI